MTDPDSPYAAPRADVDTGDAPPDRGSFTRGQLVGWALFITGWLAGGAIEWLLPDGGLRSGGSVKGLLYAIWLGPWVLYVLWCALRNRPQTVLGAIFVPGLAVALIMLYAIVRWNF
jgi:hypothetical protein